MSKKYLYVGGFRPFQNPTMGDVLSRRVMIAWLGRWSGKDLRLIWNSLSIKEKIMRTDDYFMGKINNRLNKQSVIEKWRYNV